MLRLVVLFLLFASSAAQMCQPCGIGYTMEGSGSFSDGAGGSLSCSDLKAFAAVRKQTSDVCSIIINYARQHCGCEDEDGFPAPPLPATSLTSICNPCGGTGGSDLWTMDQSTYVQETIVFSGIYVGTTPWSLKCESLWEATMDPVGGQGYITAAQCPDVQNANVRSVCGCALRDASGNVISNRNVGSPPGPSPTNAPPPPPGPSPTNAPPTNPPPTPATGGGGCVGTSEECAGDSDCCGARTCMGPFPPSGKYYCSAGRRGLRAGEKTVDAEQE